MKIRFTGCIILIAMLLGGCATYSPAVTSTGNNDSGSAYIYGKFSLAKSWNFLQMGLVVKNLTSGREYTIRLKKKDDIYAVRVEPGTYAITGLSYATGEGILSGGRSFAGRHSTPDFPVTSGYAYYIGDYFGVAEVEFGEYVWALANVKNEFEQTSRILVSNNAGFSSVVTVNVFAKGELEAAFSSNELVNPYGI